MEKERIESGEPQSRDATLDVGEQEERRHAEHEKRTGNHTAIDAYEGVMVVHQHHEVGGEYEHAELRPQIVGKEPGSQVYRHGYHCHEGQRISAFG